MKYSFSLENGKRKSASKGNRPMREIIGIAIKEIG